METEIKLIMEKLATSLLRNVGDLVKGNTKETVEEIKERNLNMSYLELKETIKNHSNDKRR
jgi:hypothetical protein